MGGKIYHLTAGCFGDGAHSGLIVVQIQRGLGGMKRGFEPTADFDAVAGRLGEGFLLVGDTNWIAHQHGVGVCGYFWNAPACLSEQIVIEVGHLLAVSDIGIKVSQLAQPGACLGFSHGHEEVRGHLGEKLGSRR